MLKPSSQWLTQALTNHSSIKAFLEPMIQLIRPNWQALGFQATVKAVRRENNQVFSLVLKPATNWPLFIAGQHIDLQIEINGVRYSRTFSISCAPGYFKQTGLIELTIREQEHGKVTQHLSSYIQNKETVNISAPRGEFTLPNDNRPLLLIAGGSGITPFRSFIQQLSLDRSDKDVHLIYYNSACGPLFADEWPLLMNAMPSLKVSCIDTASEGRITLNQLIDSCPDIEHRTAYLCGPHGLITRSMSLLMQLGVSESDIKHELFGPKPISELSFNRAAEVHFSQSNMTYTTSKEQPKSLLEIAESLHINPQSGCRMGVCHQCKCRKKQGVVYNTLTEQFSDAGEQDIQLCISVAADNLILEL